MNIDTFFSPLIMRPCLLFNRGLIMKVIYFMCSLMICSNLEAALVCHFPEMLAVLRGRSVVSSLRWVGTTAQEEIDALSSSHNPSGKPLDAPTVTINDEANSLWVTRGGGGRLMQSRIL